MKVLWVSNAPYVGSGYGVQTDLFTRRLAQAGHEVVVFGTFGHHGRSMNAGGIQILPSSLDGYGNDILQTHIDVIQPDVTVLLYDLWVIDPDTLAPITAWAPIDHDPLPPMVAERLPRCRALWAMSRFAERQMRRVAGCVPDYVPHGVETVAFQPMDRVEARARVEVEPGRFFVMMNAANKGQPPRKSLDRVLKAWAAFVEHHPDALLYLHTEARDVHNGIDLIECAAFYDIPERNLRFADPYRLARGDYSTGTMNALYNAADVLLAPSMGEGFGVPVIEAQAAGCPVIVSDFSAQSELAGPGYKVPVFDDDRYYTYQHSEQVLIRPSEIVRGLEWAHEHVGDGELREKARAFALDYDAQHVFDRYLLPSLERIAVEDRELAALRDRRTAARLALRAIPPTPPVMPAEMQKVLQGETELRTEPEKEAALVG